MLIVNLGTPDATDAAIGAALSAGVSQRRPGDREPGAGLEVRAQRHHSAAPAARQRPRLRENLESRAKRIAAEDHHPRAGRKAPRHDRGGRSDHHGRLGDALRQPVARHAHRGDGQGRLRAHPAAAALSAICRGDQRDGMRRGVCHAGRAARPAGAARGAAVLRRPGLYRGAGGFDRGRAASGCRSSPS